MKIGILSELTHTSIETIRYYEKIGLLHSAKRALNNYRQYDESHVEKLRFIHNCRSLDLSHQEIRSLIQISHNEGNHCARAEAILNEHIQHVENKIKELQILGERLKKLNQHSHENSQKTCSILQSLSYDELCQNIKNVHCTHQEHDFSH